MRSRRLVACVVVLAAVWTPASAEAITNPQIPGLQVALRAKGFYPGPIDGIAGPLTARGVRKFQRSVGISVDGVAGPITRRKLGRLGRPLFGERHLLMKRSRGWDVSVLEFFLRARGFRSGRIDGRYSWRTARAVRGYQRARHLVVDGIVGPQTLRSFGVRAVSHRRAKPVGGHRRSVRVSLEFWARHYGLRPAVVKALAWHESGWQRDVRSPVGAWGVMQVTRGTWSYVEMFLIGHRVRRTMDGNVRVGTAYLHQLMHEFRHRDRLAIGAYYQGPYSVRTHGFYPETRAFVANVTALVRRFA
jgi:Transglycosylase SLT domain/Putative peptidoglycan binding domain